MRTAATVAALLACICLPTSHAADSEQSYAVHGVGLMTCEAYLHEQEKLSRAFYVVSGWVDGYVSSMNRHVPDTYDALSFEAPELVARLLEHHCKTHPADRLHAVVLAMLNTLKADRIRARSPMIQGKVGARDFKMYAEVLQRVQRKLTDLGYYQGDPEPEFGDRTRQAIARFQQENKIDPSGAPDQMTLWRLLRDSAAAK